jgi:hypothetical protein
LPGFDTDEADSSVAENPEWKAPLDILPSQVRISRWDVEHMTAAIDSPTSGFAVLRLMDYPAWQVRLNGQFVTNRPHRDDGLMTIPIANGRSQIDVQYLATKDVWAGRTLFFASIMLLLALTRSQRHRL